MRFWKQSPGHERALRSASTEIGVGVAGWKHGNQWYYQEIQLFIDTSRLKGAKPAASGDNEDVLFSPRSKSRTPPLSAPSRCARRRSLPAKENLEQNRITGMRDRGRLVL
jgi:hypothetical protein